MNTVEAYAQLCEIHSDIIAIPSSLAQSCIMMGLCSVCQRKKCMAIS